MTGALDFIAENSSRRAEMTEKILNHEKPSADSLRSAVTKTNSETTDDTDDTENADKECLAPVAALASRVPESAGLLLIRSTNDPLRLRPAKNSSQRKNTKTMEQENAEEAEKTPLMEICALRVLLFKFVIFEFQVLSENAFGCWRAK